MDSISIGSMALESLDFLRPPVKRDFGINTTQKAYVTNFDSHIDNAQYSGDHQRKITKYQQETAEKNIDVSTSLEVKQTTDRKVPDISSGGSHTDIILKREAPIEQKETKEKPLIKVIVTPRTAQTQTPKTLKKRKHTKKLQNTVSNQENSIRPKNVYLVVAGDSREKVYEIKTTGSAKLCKEYTHAYLDSENDLKPFNFKQLINSLNMEKKKKKDKPKKKTDVVHDDQRNSLRIKTDENCDCDNNCYSRPLLKETVSPPSRVRITGHLGLVDNEQYVLKCAATVNNKPVPTNFLRADFDSPSPSYKIDENKESQATQVNFSASISKHTKDQTTQVNCIEPDNTINIVCDKRDDPVLKGCKSPLVIISVYPKVDTSKPTKKLNIRSKSPSNTKVNRKKSEKKLNSTKEIEVAKSYRTNSRSRRSASRSRSPSPPMKTENTSNISKYDKRQVEIKRVTTSSRSQSPNIATSSNRRSKLLNILNQNIKTSKFGAPDTKNDYSTKVKHFQDSKSTNTENMITKKALIDNYTKELIAHMSRNKSEDNKIDLPDQTKSDASKVTINIDGENEKYDVLFHQGNLITDLLVRKTVKETQCLEKSEDRASMRNFFVVDKQRKKRSYSQVVNDPVNESIGLNNNLSRLNVRDSIEMKHRRQDKISKDIQTSQNNKHDKNSYDESMEFLAPVKHYRGDKCCIPNPVERDKQIRELLGVETTRTNYIDTGRVHAVENYRVSTSIKGHPKWGSHLETSGHSQTIFRKEIEKYSVPYTKRLVSIGTQYDTSVFGKTSLYQQLILNRNVQVFLQVEQYTKQRPIVLSRKQYDKVKRTIERTMSKKLSQEIRKRCVSKQSSFMVSVGKVRRKEKKLPTHYNREVQTEMPEKEQHTQREYDVKIIQVENEKIEPNYNAQHSKTQVLFCKEADKISDISNDRKNISPRQAVSSLEIHYASVSFMKHVTFSSTNFDNNPGSVVTPSLGHEDSIHTIFKGRKRSVTPNLGTSEYSIYSDCMNNGKPTGLVATQEKPKKPFLKRLMSCLVMRSRASELKMPVTPAHAVPSFNSSIDSYHISTSMGALELTSSIYDTTASFYSNHTILPINSKINKRGFLSSMRGFLTIRKS